MSSGMVDTYCTSLICSLSTFTPEPFSVITAVAISSDSSSRAVAISPKNDDATIQTGLS